MAKSKHDTAKITSPKRVTKKAADSLPTGIATAQSSTEITAKKVLKVK